ncbi:transposase [Caldichromatium japonicum]|uniref:Transposase n=1 Tax=Caldichromatium japonicum TaxID=2699430 RepID=A0A6G7VFF3_9GAMM|nr:transposase [Caldichromatium japonicum]
MRHCRQGLRLGCPCRNGDRTGQPGGHPPRSNRLNPRSFNRHLYKNRNLIKRFFCRIQQFRRIATRYDKLASSSLSFVYLACTIA